MNTNLSDVGVMLDFGAIVLLYAVLPFVVWMVSVKLEKYAPQLLSAFAGLLAGGNRKTVVPERMLPIVLWVLAFLPALFWLTSGQSMVAVGHAMQAALDGTTVGWRSITLDAAPVSFKVAAAEGYIGTRLGSIYMVFGVLSAIWISVTRFTPLVAGLRLKRGRDAAAQPVPAT